jgi:regulator of cell morphogenesis and NO signaling
MIISKDMTINNIIKEYPQTITVFNKFRIDSCCGGGQTIEKAAATDGVDIDGLFQALDEAVKISNKVR